MTRYCDVEPNVANASGSVNAGTNIAMWSSLGRAALLSVLSLACLSWSCFVAAASELYYQQTPEPFHLAFGKEVSADGTTAVGYINSSALGYIWSEQNGYQTIEPHPNLDLRTRFYAVSADGSVVVGKGSRESPDPNTSPVSQPFIWSVDGGYQLLPELDAERLFVRQISSDGATVYGRVDRGDTMEYWRWSESQGYEFLPQVDEALETVVGLADDDSRLVLRRGLFDLAEETTAWLPQLVEGRFGGIWDTSADGSVVAGRMAVSDGGFQAMRWEVGSDEVQLLGVLDYPDHLSSVARGISADGKVLVGVSYAPHPELNTRPFVWDAVHGMRELEHVLRDEYGIDIHPWGMGAAEKISDDRRTIVGSTRKGRKASGSPGEMWVARLDWPLGSIRSDFDLDDQLDADDADLLIAAILEGSTDPLYDLDGSSFTSIGDLADLLRRADRVVGDTNFDGEVDFADFLVLSSNYGASGLWSQGDFDASGTVEFADFLALSGNYRSTAAAAVPEPAGALPLLLTILAIARWWRWVRVGSLP